MSNADIPTKTDGYVLCQDCGHAAEYSSERHHGQEKCNHCGGEYCGCIACHQIASANVQFYMSKQTSEIEPVKGRAPGLSEQASSFGQTEARAKHPLDPARKGQPP